MKQSSNASDGTPIRECHDRSSAPRFQCRLWNTEKLTTSIGSESASQSLVAFLLLPVIMRTSFVFTTLALIAVTLASSTNEDGATTPRRLGAPDSIQGRICTYCRSKAEEEEFQRQLAAVPEKPKGRKCTYCRHLENEAEEPAEAATAEEEELA